MPLTQVQPGMLGTPQPYNFKNRIINGAMMIDQRNGGASTNNGNATEKYSLDRWNSYGQGASIFSMQQNAGSVTPPAGFINYLGVTSLAATSITSQNAIYQAIEGLNIADLGFGTANAKTITVSFWVRSSLTGTFGGSIRNGVANRSYPFSFTINSANTWEFETITIAGDTTGSWLTNNGVGLYLTFDLGSPAGNRGTAGSWSANNFVGVTGANSVVNTNGATFYITGVQLEVGVSATTFDYRAYGQELALCQRYYQKRISGNSGTGGIIGLGVTLSTTASIAYIDFRQQMRSSPTITQANMIVSNSLTFDASVSAITGGGSSDGAYLTLTHATATSGQTVNIRAGTNTNGFIAFDSEL